MRKSLALAMTAATTAGLAAFVPATANAGSNTDLTFSVLSGGLSLSAPTSATLQSGGGALTLGQTAGTVTGTLSGVTVTDNRGGLASQGWTVSLGAMSDFAGKDAQGASVGSIPASGGTVTAGTATLTGLTGGSLVVPSGAVTMSTGGAVVTAAANLALGNSYSATFDETVSVSVPTSASPGTYTSTMTQTVT